MCGMLQVWVIENSMEVVARQLLLLYLSLQTPENMSLHSTYLHILRQSFCSFKKLYVYNL